MALLTVKSVVLAGVDATLVAAAGGGDTFPNTGKEMLLVENASGSPMDVTIVSQATVDSLAVDDLTITVADGVMMAIGPFLKSAFNDNDDLVHVTYSDETAVTVGVVHF